MNNLRQISEFGLLGSSSEASSGVLDASWAVWGPSWASWADRSATRDPPGPSSGPLGALLVRLGALLGPQKSRVTTWHSPGGYAGGPG
eukprot:9029527-Pyramimonas_sp.AAC.1